MAVERRMLAPSCLSFRLFTYRGFCQNGVKFPSALCLAGKETWWQLASRCCWNRARPWHASELVSFLVRLRTYQHPGYNNSRTIKKVIIKLIPDFYRSSQILNERWTYLFSYIRGAPNIGGIKFVRLHLVFMISQYWTCFMSPLWRLELFWGGF